MDISSDSSSLGENGNIKTDIKTDIKIHIRIVSDIHLEYRKDKLPYIKPFNRDDLDNPLDITCCILAGDIGHPMASIYKEFLIQTKKDFNIVLVIAGNHEYYKQLSKLWSVDQIVEKISLVCNETKCIFLNRSSHIISLGSRNIRFLGCTLWTDIPLDMQYEISQELYDFRKIAVKPDPKIYSRSTIQDRLFTINDYLEFHKQDLSWLTQELEKDKETLTIVITHHAPLEKMLFPRYTRGFKDPINYAFANNLIKIVNNPIYAWISGHTHNFQETRVNNVLCISNCMGYPGESNVNYDENYEILI
jgi:predicted phosphodiesterase